MNERINLYKFITGLFILLPLCLSGIANGASFDCSKAGTETEKMICADAEMSKMDEELGKAYAEAIKKAPDPVALKEQQLAWLKERNSCPDVSCMKDQYQLRIGELNRIVSLASLDKLAVETSPLLNAQIEAKSIYEKSRDVYRPIEILRKAQIDSITEKKPEDLTAKKYSAILFDYARYLYDTEDDAYRHKNQQLAQRLLIQAKKHAPGNIDMQLLLARSYLRHFKFSVRTELGWGVDHRPRDESWRTTLPPLLKQAYTEYTALCRTKNIQPELSDEEWLIVRRQRLFIEYYSTFTNDQPKYGPAHEQYKPEFENICSEYVALLNQMPDDEYMQCSRYAVDEDDLFNIKPVISEDWRKQINYHLVIYRGEEFFDKYGSLFLEREREHSCLYKFIDFNLECQIKDSSDCRYKLEKHFFKKQNTTN